MNGDKERKIALSKAQEKKIRTRRSKLNEVQKSSSRNYYVYCMQLVALRSVYGLIFSLRTGGASTFAPGMTIRYTVHFVSVEWYARTFMTFIYCTVVAVYKHK